MGPYSELSGENTENLKNNIENIKESIKQSKISKKINNYKKINENLEFQEIKKLLEMDSIYEQIPKDISRFRKVNTYLDPRITLKRDKITFLRIANSNLSEEKIKEKFNQYLNVKYNHITNPLSYKDNMNKFVRQSEIVTKFINDILSVGAFPEYIKKIFSEYEELKKNPNLFELMILYKKTKNKRLKFEILRKIGLIDLICRIEKSFPIEQTDFITKEIEKLFSIGLGLKKHKTQHINLWLDENNRAKFTYDSKKAKDLYNKACRMREIKGLEKIPIQTISYSNYDTKFKKRIEIIQIRNKLRQKKEINYTSFLEKMIRKNIEFPNQIHDTIGVRIVVENNEDIPNYIRTLEKFIGGSSSRKKEKDTIHKFGKEKLNPYSSKDYYVWKAIYDIAVPNFAIKHLIDIKRNVKEEKIKQIVNKKIDNIKKNPINAVIEVQVQDLESYMLSIAKGSSTEHAKLKMNEIRQNSFFKIFPKEVYEAEINKLKNKILENI